jgi:hypothetical protein
MNLPKDGQTSSAPIIQHPDIPENELTPIDLDDALPALALIVRRGLAGNPVDGVVLTVPGY